MLYVLVCFLTFATAGILGAFTAIDWFTIVDNPIIPNIFENEMENLRNSVAATSVSFSSNSNVSKDWVRGREV